MTNINTVTVTESSKIKLNDYDNFYILIYKSKWKSDFENQNVIKFNDLNYQSIINHQRHYDYEYEWVSLRLSLSLWL